MTVFNRCKGCAWDKGMFCEIFVNRGDPWLLSDGKCAAYATKEDRQRIEQEIEDYAITYKWRHSDERQR